MCFLIESATNLSTAPHLKKVCVMFNGVVVTLHDLIFPPLYLHPFPRSFNYQLFVVVLVVLDLVVTIVATGLALTYCGCSGELLMCVCGW